MARQRKSGKTSAQTANALIKSEQAVQLRCAGLSISSIATTLGIPKTTAFSAIERALALQKSTIAKDAEVLRAMMVMQLDELHKRWWPAAMGLKKRNAPETEPDPTPDRFALDRILKIMDRKMALVGLVDISIDPTNSAAQEALRAKTEAYKTMGIVELTRLFSEMVKSPLLLDRPAALKQPITIDQEPQPEAAAP